MCGGGVGVCVWGVCVGDRCVHVGVCVGLCVHMYAIAKHIFQIIWTCFIIITTYASC